MSDKQYDPAAETVDESQRNVNTYDGQQGYGVDFENGKFIKGDLSDAANTGRNGSFETNNQGGYGNSQEIASTEDLKDRAANDK